MKICSEKAGEKYFLDKTKAVMYIFINAGQRSPLKSVEGFKSFLFLSGSEVRHLRG